MGLLDLIFSSDKTSGNCGKNLTWAINGDTLKISGSGEMENRTVNLRVPWFKKHTIIKSVVID